MVMSCWRSHGYPPRLTRNVTLPSTRLNVGLHGALQRWATQLCRKNGGFKFKIRN
jgi:hypothetical protein